MSRRALLGAALGAFATPVREAQGLLTMSGAEGAPPPPFGWSPSPSLRDREDEWGSALGAFSAAVAAVQRIEAATAGGSFEEEEAWLPAHEAACSAMGEALERVMRAPAPGAAALVSKIALLFSHVIEPGGVDEGVAAAVLADVRRVLGSERPSPCAA